MNLSIIIPANNEEANIKCILLNLKETLKGNYEVIMVDDYSFDKTFSIVQEILHNFPQLRIISNPYKKGFVNALKTGINMASGNVIIPVMADLCDEIAIIPRIYNKILEGNDIVCTSRYIEGGKRQGGPILKAFLSRYASWLIHKISKVPSTDLTNSFKAYRKRVLENIPIESDGYEISMEIVLKAYLKGYKITEISTNWRERTRGQSHFAILRDGTKFMRWFIFGLSLPFLKIKQGIYLG